MVYDLTVRHLWCNKYWLYCWIKDLTIENRKLMEMDGSSLANKSSIYNSDCSTAKAKINAIYTLCFADNGSLEGKEQAVFNNSGFCVFNGSMLWHQIGNTDRVIQQKYDVSGSEAALKMAGWGEVWQGCFLMCFFGLVSWCTAEDNWRERCCWGPWVKRLPG